MGSKSDDYLLKVVDLGTHFFSREGTLRAVDGVDFAVRRGQTLGIVGESGCGKSVTAQSILRIVPKNGKIVTGQILLKTADEVVDLAQLDPEGDEIRAIQGKEVAMIFQEPMTSFCPVYTIGNQITEVIRLHQEATKGEAHERALDILRHVSMPNPEQAINAYPFNLSGGMRQRAMIAMALSCRPSLLIADEPTTAVDVTIQAQVLDLISRLQRELGMAVILITHDLGVVGDLADDVLVMYLGRNVESAEARQLFRDPKHPYTQGLLASIPKLGEAGGRKIEPISGSVPSIYEMPKGCRFHPRCPEFISGVCDEREPPSVETAPHHFVSCWLYADR